MEVTDMYKQEQCISNLEQQIGWIEDIKAHQFPGWGHTVNAMRQAIALLKAQEAVEPKAVNMYPHGQYACGNCGHISVGSKDFRANYCPKCGRAVKWE